MLHNWYGASAEEIIGNIWLANPIACALLDEDYVEDRDTHKIWAHVSAHEVTGPAYTAGGILLVDKTAPYDPATDRTDLRCADLTWGPLATFRPAYAVIYDTSGSQALWSLLDFEGVKNVANGIFVIDWAEVGPLAVLAPAA